MVEAGLAAKKAGLVKLEDACAILDRSSPFVEVADNYDLPVKLVDHRSFEDKAAFRIALTHTLIGIDVDNLFLTFDWLLSASVVRHYRNKIVNLHMSHLPLFPGRGAVTAALQSGMKTAGITYHLVDEGVDTGPIVAQSVTPVFPGMSQEQLGRALFKRAVPLGIQVLRWLEQSRLVIEPSRYAVVSVAQAAFNDGPFFPALDADVQEFAKDFLTHRYPD